MFDFLNILGWLGFGGAITVILLAIFAPAVLNVASSWLSSLAPLIKGAAEGVVWFLKTMWEGFKDMADNAASIVFVVVCIVAALWYGHNTGVKKTEEKIAEIESPSPIYKAKKLRTPNTKTKVVYKYREAPVEDRRGVNDKWDLFGWTR